MTTLYSDNFDSDTAGVNAPGWTAVSGTWVVGTTLPISGTQSLSCTTLTDKQVNLYTASGFAQTDQSASVDFLYDVATVRCKPCPMIRVTNTSLGNGYVGLIGGSGSDTNVSIFKVVAGVYTSLGFGAHGVTLVAGTTKVTLEVRAVGTTIEVRLYLQGGARPSTPSFSVTDSTSSAGAPGIFSAWSTPATAGGYDNFVWTDGAVAATATTLSGPSSGAVGVASTNFTVGANGTITGTVVITPSDGGAGGTFTPTTVSISSGSPTGTFTYTPSSSGAKTISTTNNGSLTNPSNLTYTVSSGSTTLPVDSAGITWSPGNWDALQIADFGVSVKSMQTTACGAYLKFSVTGTTTVSLALDASVLSGFGVNVPYLMWSIADGANTMSLLTVGASSLSLATGLTVGTTYTVQVYLRGAVESQGDRWGSSGVSPTNVLRIQGIIVDTGGSISAYPLVNAKKALCFGDSRTEGVRAAGTTTEPQDHARTWPWFLGRAMACEVGVIGYGATGWARTGSGNMPVFPTSFPSYSVGRARSFGSPDYVFVMHGFNDISNGVSVATVQAAIQTWLSAARTACPSSWIFVIGDVSGLGSAAYSGAVAAYQAANPSDTKVALIDVSDVLETVPFSGPVNTGTPTWGAIDKCHPYEFAQGMIGSAVARKAQSLIGGGAVTPTSGAVAIGASQSLTISPGSKVTLATGGGFYTVSINEVGGSAMTQVQGPITSHRSFGPYNLGATVVVSNQSCSSLIYVQGTL